MTKELRHLRKRRWLLALLLPAVWLHLLIPAGFMPASDAPLSVEICPEGFPAGLLAHAVHHHHTGGDGHGSSEHCAFGTACGGAPLSQQPLRLESQCIELDAAESCAAPILLIRLVHLPEARGPPLA